MKNNFTHKIMETMAISIVYVQLYENQRLGAEKGERKQ